VAGDRLMTGESSRALLQWYDRSQVQLSELTSIEIPPPPAPQKRSGLKLLKGLLHFFHRDEPREYEIRSPIVWATILGTEFTLQAAEDQTTTLNLIAGQAALSNNVGGVRLANHERGVAQAGPPRSLCLEAVNDLIQWFLYYPAVLDLSELPLSPEEATSLGESLAAYRAGDLLQALSRYPEGSAPNSPAEKAYRAALLLSVGQVARATALLDSVPADRGDEARCAALAMEGRLVH
jgi:hypothetical protein